jgi:hypothetical protein
MTHLRLCRMLCSYKVVSLYLEAPKISNVCTPIDFSYADILPMFIVHFTDGDLQIGFVNLVLRTP